MSDEAAGPVAERLPEELQEWIGQRADETDRSSAEVLEYAVTLNRLLEQEVDEETASIDRLVDKVAALENELDTKITDVRERVIQVKRETDAKAPIEHGHPDLREELETAVKRTDEIEETIDQLGTDLAALDETVEDGFDNYETVVSHLSEHVDDLDQKTIRLARVVVNLREQMTGFESAEMRRELTAELKRTANQEGIRQADCGACGNRVDIGLLTAPRCPHCDAAYRGVEPGSRLFRSATLTIGERPALDGETDPSATTAEDILKEATTDD